MLTKRLYRISVGTIAILLVVALMSYAGVQKLIDTNSWLVHTEEVLEQLQHLLFTVTDAASAERAFLITGQDSFLEEYNAAKDEADQTLSSIRALVRDNPSQIHRLDELQPMIDERLASFDVSIEVYKTKGSEAAFNRVREGKGKQFFDALRQKVGEMTDEEKRLFSQRATAVMRSAEDSKKTIIAGSILAVIFILITAFFLGQDISGPFQLLLRSSENIKKGRFDAVTKLNTDDEFGELSTVFNDLGHSLRAALGSVEEEADKRQRMEELVESLKQNINTLSLRSDVLLSGARELRISFEGQPAAISP